MLGEELYKSRMENFAKEKDKLIELNENLEKAQTESSLNGDFGEKCRHFIPNCSKFMPRQ